MNENATDAAAAEPETDGRRAEFQASWDDRLLPLLTDDWQSADNLAKRLNTPKHTVLARLKDMMRRNLVERRIVDEGAKKKAPRRRPRMRMNVFIAEFRRPPMPGAAKR